MRTANNKDGSVLFDFDFIQKHLGCETYEVLETEDLLEEFIVQRAILDINLPKLLQNDHSIFENVCSDVFPKTPKPNVHYGKIKELTEQRLLKKGLYAGEDFMQSILNLYETTLNRHGVMLVGSPVTGKTMAIKIL